ncbi:T9SS type A sorting domain-containing protein [Flavivirga algicola]|uniref:T9SS type A sorting domain-containing protein n=1 Tax=Flavivirga algicola TaxID=2729136 RepID=A0ABX1RT43_9FLAO|nr:T9SS type A sorting domain-containing protein [Flavivirga algicola]NMH85948.1 T9SS type A sorting domain-containing protein [Flavivirga algicola]
MKNIILIVLTLFCFVNYGFSQQHGNDREYVLYVNGRIGQGSATCNSHGLQDIIITLASGRTETIFGFDSTNNRYSNRTFITAPYTFSYGNRPVSIRFRSRARRSNWNGCRRLLSQDEGLTTYRINNYDCYFRRIVNSDGGGVRANTLFPGHGGDDENWAEIRIVPKPSIGFADGTPSNAIQNVCSSNGSEILVGRGYSNPSRTYNWEFLDNIHTETRQNPELLSLRHRVSEARRAVDFCEAYTGRYCQRERSILYQAREDLRNFSGPQTVQVPVWRPITNKDGQSNIRLRPTDLYSNANDRNELVGQTVQVRLNPSCYDRGPDSNALSLRFLPDAPSVSGPPQVIQPSCSYSEFNRIRIPFAGGIASNQKISISLKRLAVGQSPYRNSDSAQSLGITNQEFNRRVNQRYPNEYKNVVNVRNSNLGSGWYNWDLNAGSDPDHFAGGHYAIVVTSYETSDTGNNTPSCLPKYYFFEVTAPAALDWSVNNITSQTCYGVSDGSFQIRVNSGRAPYRYRINGGRWIGFSGRSNTTTVSGLAPRSNSNPYRVEVVDANGCGQRANPRAPNRTVNVSINGIPSRISHNVPIDRIQHPTRPGERNGVIEVASIRGGTPSGRFGYRYSVLRNGTPVSGYQNLTSRGNIVLRELPEGTYTINYHDGNDCEQTLPLAVLRDPRPISFDIETTLASCNGVNNGSIRVLNVRGTSGPYTFTWYQNGSVIPRETTSSLTRGAGTGYSVEVTSSSGFGSRDNISIGLLPEVQVERVDVSELLCYNGTAMATITARGGSGNYEYGVWNGNATVWQSSNRISVSYSSAGYRFAVRDVLTRVCISEPSAVYNLDRPDELYISSNNVTNNTVFGGNEGRINIEVAGGTGRYRYEWSKENDAAFSSDRQNIRDLQAGRYTIRIFDRNNCSIEERFEVTEPDRLEASVNITSAIPCFEGTGNLTAIVRGGLLDVSGQYRYQWFVRESGAFRRINGQTAATIENQPVGTYRVEVWDDYTSITTEQNLTEPNLLALSLSKTDVSCFSGDDGTISLSPQGGTAPYFYSLDGNNFSPISGLVNNTINRLTSQEYNVWLRDSNNCTIDSPVNVELEQPVSMDIELINNDPATTVGGTNGALDISVSLGAAPYTYLWSLEGNATFTATTEDIRDLSSGTYTVTVTDSNHCSVQANFEVLQPAPLEIEFVDPLSIRCYGDENIELRVEVQGGYPFNATPDDFEFRWYRMEGSIANLMTSGNGLVRLPDLGAGRYRVEVEDVEGTIAETSIELTQPDELIVTLDGDPTQVLCHGQSTGAINITVTGGPVDPNTGENLPYTIRWSKVEDPGYTGITEDLRDIGAGTYEVVVVDDNLCTASLLAPVVITEPDAPLEIINVQATNLSGYQTANGSISLEVTGGTAPYTYAWTNSDDATYSEDTEDIDDLSIGTYALLVTDANGCTESLVQTITEPEQLLIDIIPLTEAEGIQCYDEETVMPLTTNTRGGVGMYTYQWFNEDNPGVIISTESDLGLVKEGTYMVVITDENGNTANDTYEVTQPDRLSLSENVTHMLCHNDTDGRIDISVIGGVPPYEYSWSNGEQTEDIGDLRSGIYTVIVTDANFCEVRAEIEVEQPNSLFADIDRQYPSSSTVRDGRVIVDVRGGVFPYQYQWYNETGDLLPFTASRLDNIGPEKYALTITDANNCELIIDDIDLFVPPALEVVIEQQSVISCHGNTETGNIVAIVNGGVPFNSRLEYEYQWYNATNNQLLETNNPVLSRVGAGIYYVSITDAIGTMVQSEPFELEEPDRLVVSFEADYINCGNEDDWTIGALVEGGTPPYRYRWNTGANKQQLEEVLAGTYSISITDSRGCTTQGEVTITVPEQLRLAYNTVMPICHDGCDGSITLDLTGGVPPYNYEWNTGVTERDLNNICAGDYEVVITDAKGCQLTQQIRVGNPEQLIVDLGEDVTLCVDQTTILDASIADVGATYQWSATNGFTSNNPIVEVYDSGIYEVLVTSSEGCEATGSIFVDRSNDVIRSEFIASTQVFAGEKFVLVNISDPIADQVEWLFPEQAQVSFEDNNYAEFTIDTPGEYEISMFIERGLCTDISTKRVIVVEREYEEEAETGKGLGVVAKFEYMVYPNPTSDGRFSVDVALREVLPISIKVFDMVNNHQVVYDRQQGSDHYIKEYDLSGLPTGIYFVLLETQGQSQVRKLIKK